MDQAVSISFSSGLEPVKNRQTILGPWVVKTQHRPALLNKNTESPLGSFCVTHLYLASERPWSHSSLLSLGLWRCCQPREKPAELRG